MARLFDRIMYSCKAAHASSFLIDRETRNSGLYNQLDKIVAKEFFDFSKFENVPVIAADDVAFYVSTLPEGTKFRDVVASMAPPFNGFFIEFQKVPNKWNLYAWGVLISAIEDPKKIIQMEGDDNKPRWILNFETFIEYKKGHPIGPIADHQAGLGEDGTWFRHANNEVWWGGGPVEFDEDPPVQVVQQIGNNVAQLLFPVLLTISFIHCKNTNLIAMNPSEKLSKKHKKRTGHDLIRYHILDIDPLRKLFEQYKTNKKTDLRNAFHLCRGHFKTFTKDAPLFGKYTGTFWWDQQARGSQKAGIVLKDYRVSAPAEIGRVYRKADESPTKFSKKNSSTKDPDSYGRGLMAHNKTQNKIASIVLCLGWAARSPKLDEPEYDIAWKINETLYVCEVKSLTDKNEEKQLRLAIGQVIRYRQKLNSVGHEPVRAVIATEKVPNDKSWFDLCEQENIILISPSDATEKLSVLKNN